MNDLSDVSVITLDRVSKSYGAVKAVQEVSLDVQRGEMFGLIGPDGAGKTTLIRLICGLLRADGGDIRVVGRHPVREHRAVTRSVGYLSQRFSLYGDLTIDENIAFFAEIHGVWRYTERRERLLTLTQLLPFRARRADQLSGGMKQKLALACTLVHEPALLLLDEPTTGVDPVSRREFWKLLAEFLSQGLTILIATPYLDEAERCARVALVHEGRLLALDAPERLQESHPGRLVEVVAEPIRETARLLADMPGIADVQLFGERVHARLQRDAGTDSLAQIEEALAANPTIRVLNIRPIAASLEDVFIEKVVSGNREQVITHEKAKRA